MKIAVLGGGNSGYAMAAHLALEGHEVKLWNRSYSTIAELMAYNIIYCQGAIEGEAKIDLITTHMDEAVHDVELILVTTPASAHADIARQLAEHIKRPVTIVLNPGRTFGAIEFSSVLRQWGCAAHPIIAETQSIIYTCRKTSPTSVFVFTLKNDVLLSTITSTNNKKVIANLPSCIGRYFVPAQSMIQTSIGNVGMILHCAPALLNAGWIENERNSFKYYHDGITPSIASFLEQLDNERIEVSRRLGWEVESVTEWIKRSYGAEGDTLYSCIQDVDAYNIIEAPSSLRHRYIYEDVPYGLVPLEGIGNRLGLSMKMTGLVIDLANSLLNIDFRKIGRNSERLDIIIPEDRVIEGF